MLEGFLARVEKVIGGYLQPTLTQAEIGQVREGATQRHEINTGPEHHARPFDVKQLEVGENGANEQQRIELCAIQQQ